MAYKTWKIVSFLLSCGIGVVINPATFGIGLSGNITLNIIIRAGMIIVIYFILSRLGKSKAK